MQRIRVICHSRIDSRATGEPAPQFLCLSVLLQARNSSIAPPGWDPALLPTATNALAISCPEGSKDRESRNNLKALFIHHPKHYLDNFEFLVWKTAPVSAHITLVSLSKAHLSTFLASIEILLIKCSKLLHRRVSRWGKRPLQVVSIAWKAEHLTSKSCRG